MNAFYPQLRKRNELKLNRKMGVIKNEIKTFSEELACECLILFVITF